MVILTAKVISTPNYLSETSKDDCLWFVESWNSEDSFLLRKYSFDSKATKMTPVLSRFIYPTISASLIVKITLTLFQFMFTLIVFKKVTTDGVQTVMCFTMANHLTYKTTRSFSRSSTKCWYILKNNLTSSMNIAPFTGTFPRYEIVVRVVCNYQLKVETVSAAQNRYPQRNANMTTKELAGP